MSHLLKRAVREILRAVYPARPIKVQSAALDLIEDKLESFNITIPPISLANPQIPPRNNPRDLILGPLLRLHLLFNGLLFYRGTALGRFDHEKRLHYEEALLFTVVEMCEVANYLGSHYFLPLCPGWM